MNALRWIAIGLVFSMGLLQAKEAKEPERFWYLAVPSAPAKCLFFSCVRFSAQEKAAKKEPFFTLWRSGYWDEKTPDIVVKNPGDWGHALDVRARQAVAAKPEMSQFPPAVAEFFVALETLRAAALNQPLVVEPLSRNQHFAGWENRRHLELLVLPDALGPRERPKRLLEAMQAPEKERSMDLGEWMKMFLTGLGVKVQSARYYPEYNVFLFEADGDFKEHMDILFSAIGG